MFLWQWTTCTNHWPNSSANVWMRLSSAKSIRTFFFFFFGSLTETFTGENFLNSAFLRDISPESICKQRPFMRELHPRHITHVSLGNVLNWKFKNSTVWESSSTDLGSKITWYNSFKLFVLFYFFWGGVLVECPLGICIYKWGLELQNLKNLIEEETGSISTETLVQEKAR